MVATEKMRFFLLVLMTLYLPGHCIQLGQECNEEFGDLWEPSWAKKPRNDLRCKLDDTCKKEPTVVKSEEFDICCSCKSCAVWEGSEVDLFIEFVSVTGRSLVLSDQAPNETEVYKIEQMDSEMTKMPSNLCNWDNETRQQEIYAQAFNDIQEFWEKIVVLNFENNKIDQLSDLSCLLRLDTLNLRYNKLTHLSNTSFTKLPNLRSIDVSRNRIQAMDPNILNSRQMQSLFYADFSHNDIKTLDVSNIFPLHPFCNIDYQSNKITELVNEADFTLDMSESYGPGFVSIRDNDFSTWPDFKDLLNLNSVAELGHLISFGFDFRDIPLTCDCNLEEFMSTAYDVIDVLWRKYMDIKCTAPPDLAGKHVFDVDPQRFICPVENGCDPRCTCVDQPNKNTFFIDCSNSGLKTLPDIPDSKFSKYISLNVSGNDIKKIENTPYLPRISVLDISSNNLLEINESTSKLLENATYIDIFNNPGLRQLPQTFQFHNVCARYMRNLQISCDCDSLWIEQWLRSKPCVSESSLFECVVPQAGVKPALSFHKSVLKCSPNNFPFFLETIIAGAILILLIITIPIYIFRYEILILYLRARQKRKGNTVLPLHKYDVFLSFNDTDDIVSDWVYLTLEPQLVKAGYRVFQPSQDVAFGAERDTEIISILSKTRNFLAILSDSYLTEADEGMRSWTENEWKYGWNNFKADRSKNTVLVNFDHVSSFDVDHPQIKAFLRVGCTVDFKNQDRKIMEDIFRKLGKPFKMPCLPSKGFENKNLKFPKHELFTVDRTNQRVYLTDNQLLHGKNELLAKELEPKNIDILTKYQTCNGDISLENVLKPLKGQKQQKKCQFRKCFACNNVDNGQEIIQNANKSKVSKAYRNSTSRFKLHNQLNSSNKLDGSQDKLSNSNHNLVEERDENMTIPEDQHENTKISEDQHENTCMSEDEHENTSMSKDKVGYRTAYNMHSFPGTEEAPEYISMHVSMHAVVPQKALATDSRPIQHTNFPENLCVTDLDPKGRPETLEGSDDERQDLDKDISVTRNTADLQCLRNSRQCFLQENISETRSSAGSSVTLETVTLSDIFV